MSFGTRMKELCCREDGYLERSNTPSIRGQGHLYTVHSSVLGMVIWTKVNMCVQLHCPSSTSHGEFTAFPK